MNTAETIALLMIPTIGLFCWHIYITKRYRLRFIADYKFSPVIKDKLAEKYPNLGEADRNRVIEELRYFLLMVLHSPEIAMPSRVVDAAWHEFILLTNDYSAFCKQAYGCYFHHIPVTAGNSERHKKKAENVWRWSCQEERLHPELPTRLPRLFAIDAELGIPDGFYYSLADVNYPLTPVTQPPKDLGEKIHMLLSQSAEIEHTAAIAMLSRSIRSRLSSETYRTRYAKSEFDQLFESIFVYPDLTMALFDTTDRDTIKADRMSAPYPFISIRIALLLLLTLALITGSGCSSSAKHWYLSSSPDLSKIYVEPFSQYDSPEFLAPDAAAQLTQKIIEQLGQENRLQIETDANSLTLHGTILSYQDATLDVQGELYDGEEFLVYSRVRRYVGQNDDFAVTMSLVAEQLLDELMSKMRAPQRVAYSEYYHSDSSSVQTGDANIDSYYNHWGWWRHRHDNHNRPEPERHWTSDGKVETLPRSTRLVSEIARKRAESKNDANTPDSGSSTLLESLGIVAFILLIVLAAALSSNNSYHDFDSHHDHKHHHSTHSRH